MPRVLLTVFLLCSTLLGNEAWRITSSKNITIHHMIGSTSVEHIWSADSTGGKRLGFRMTDHIRYEDNVFYVRKEGNFIKITTIEGEVPPISANKLVSIEYSEKDKNTVYWVHD